MNSVEARHKHAELVAKAREAASAHEIEQREFSAEDKAKVEKIMSEVDTIEDLIESLESIESADAPAEDAPAPEQDAPRSRKLYFGEGRKFDSEAERRQRVQDFSQWGLSGAMPERRDTILGTDGKGGYLTPPVKLANDIVIAKDNLIFMRQLGSVQPSLQGAKTYGVPQMSSRMGSANWTTEVGSITEDTSMAFTRRDLNPVPLTKLALASILSLENEANVENIIKDQLTYQFVQTEENGFINGSGSGQPLGLFTASSNGIPAANDFVAGTTTALTADLLIAATYQIKQPYLQGKSVGWLFHRQSMKQVRQLKDSQNRYLWEPSLVPGQPATLLGYPVYLSEYVPSTFTTGLYVGMFADFSYYWIVDRGSMQIQRLVERYVDTNQIGFVGREFVDGSPVLAEAFVRLKLA